MEYALPVDAAVSALREIERLIARQNLRVNVPIEVRCAPADD
ncbi:hypothetical protein KDL01_23355, partial [Actinospica durhamensis]|nr:hypothetical protein [Actinospica durhamensis]